MSVAYLKSSEFWVTRSKRNAKHIIYLVFVILLLSSIRAVPACKILALTVVSVAYHPFFRFRISFTLPSLVKEEA